MPKLKFVNLSFNSLSTPLHEVEVDRNLKWQQLRNLVLNSTYVSWESVQEILDHLPGLEELHLSLNEYNNVRLQNSEDKCHCKENDNENESQIKCSCVTYKLKHKHSGIRILHFNGNPIEDWLEVVKLGFAFPNLETLVLADCPIRSLHMEEAPGCNSNFESVNEPSSGRDSPHESFRNLKVLNLNATQLSSWDDIEELAKFPMLECMRIQVRIKYVN